MFYDEFTCVTLRMCGNDGSYVELCDSKAYLLLFMFTIVEGVV